MPANQLSQPHSAPLPAGLRIACPGDQGRLFSIFHAAWRENGFGGFNAPEVRRVLDAACQGSEFVIGLIDGADRIEAVLGLMPTKPWYGGDADWFWTELMFFVHPEHRRSHHAQTLFAFADWFERHSLVPVVISVFPTERLAAKERLFARHARPAGAIYLIGDGVWRNAKAA